MLVFPPPFFFACLSFLVVAVRQILWSSLPKPDVYCEERGEQASAYLFKLLGANVAGIEAEAGTSYSQTWLPISLQLSRVQSWEGCKKVRRNGPVDLG